MKILAAGTDMCKYKVPIDLMRESPRAIKVPVGEHGDFPVRFYQLLPKSVVEIGEVKDRELSISVQKWFIEKKRLDGLDQIIRPVSR